MNISFCQLFLNDKNVVSKPLLDRVDFFDVSLNVLLFAGPVGAHFALERLGSRVDPPVLVELGRSKKVFSTVGTHVVSLDSVGLQVFSKGSVVGIRLTTQLAHGIADVHVVLCTRRQKQKKRQELEVSFNFFFAGFLLSF